MQKLHDKIIWAVVASEASHIFCCVLPTIFSIASLMSGLGLIGVMPGFLVTFHEIMHGWEVPMIIFSGVVIAVGWGLIYYNEKHGCCHHTGCSHGPCTPRTSFAKKVLIVASVLFVVNVSVYTLIHRGMDTQSQVEATHEHAH